ncbi:BamA/TamA family outer membrane protein [Sandaracinus amylolyticus]|uniref:Uncharacterized protein n=1 Tax=Sandaracinus amylolyticus TaxID=927083 RepID=A0A0F6YIW0_9BACT|nr:BamA/TamA family outer membrane protein [Sandaracinus amylolyticus]AKF07422.1 Hypothetical protein DB32_004571 [Sandaracinus amylolyticus]
MRAALQRFALGLALALLAAVPVARADSSEWNLHLDPAFATPAIGLLAPDDAGLRGAGLFVWGGVDWQLARPFALELIVGGGHMWSLGPPRLLPDGTDEEIPGATFVHGGIGGRLRLVDDESGYLDQSGGSAAGSLWISAHVGAMAWHGPELAIDLALGYELSLVRPVSAGLYARAVLGLFGEGAQSDVDLLLTLGVSLSFEVTVGVIPNGRYGVSDVHIEGLEDLDEAALRACLGTRERGTFALDIVTSSSLQCGQPPFDGDRLRVELFSWPWTDWPLFDASVFERDMLRVQRWLRARGYYEGRVVASRVEPVEALGEGGTVATREPSSCVADDTRGCEVRVSITVDEGEPVRVARVTLRGEREIEESLRLRLRAALELRRDMPFDEALYERTKRAMVRVLADSGYPDARVEGEVKLNTARHEAYLLFRIETGPRGVLGRICVTGYGELPPGPILAATYLSPGDEFRLSEIEEAQRAIFALGTMGSVEIRHTTLEAMEEERAEAERAAEDQARPRDDQPTGAAETAPAPAPEQPAEDVAPTSETPDPNAPASEASPEATDPPPPDEQPADDAPDAAVISSATEDTDTGLNASPDTAVSPPSTPYCTDAPTSVPDGARAVDLEIRVSAGRLERFGLGVGIQAGDTLSFGNQSQGGVTTVNQIALQQWDIHLLLVAEWRNLFGNMLRVRLEERPRLIFPAQFPGVTSDAGEGPTLGNRIGVTVRWPAFIEARTALFAGLTHDYGPIPLWGFFRHELDGRIGLERTFFDGRLYVSSAIRGNLFVPDEGQNLQYASRRESTRVLFLEQIATLDLRDDPRNPSLGAFFSVGLQEAGFGGVSSWDYFRITAEGRGYVPLGLGIVLAARFAVGAMFIGDTYFRNDGVDDIYDLDVLGPLSQQLQGGGSISNRGFPPGLLGDVRRDEIKVRGTYVPGGPQDRPIIISGGTYRWEGSLELRFPITTELGLVLFTDVGNVSRDAFDFMALNLAFGLGIRYRTIVGPLRFDIAFRPDALQYVGGEDPRRFCQSDDQNDGCTPIPVIDIGDLSFPGAIHLTIGEAF